jgi:prepilin-type N-terminal cleavage/methylation domain-containing protein
MICRNPSSRAGDPPGFTLLEMLACLAIVALLLGVAAHSAMGRMQQANRDHESAELARMVRALERSVSRNLAVPAPADWVAAVAAELSQPAVVVATNPRGGRRELLVDPLCRLGPQPGDPLPYVQSSAGSLRPERVRFLLLSSLAAPLPDLAGVGFDALWNAPAGRFPAGWPPGWPGVAADVLIVRLDLEAQFRRVIFNNHDLVSASHSVGPAAPLPLASLAGREAWLLAGSRLNLHYADGSLQGSEFVFEDVSYSFEAGQWSRGIREGRGLPVSSSLVGLAASFLNTPLPPSRLRTRGSPQSILHSFHLFMSTYALWSANGFGDGDANWEEVVEQLQAALQAMVSISN